MREAISVNGVAEGKGNNIDRKLEMTKRHITHNIQGDTNSSLYQTHCTIRRSKEAGQKGGSLFVVR